MPDSNRIKPAQRTVWVAMSTFGSPNSFRVDSPTAIRVVRDYNAGSYRGRTNIEIDRLAYEHFRDGIPANEAALIDMVRFVGEDFAVHSVGSFPTVTARRRSSLSPSFVQYSTSGATRSSPLVRSPRASLTSRRSLFGWRRSLAPSAGRFGRRRPCTFYAPMLSQSSTREQRRLSESAGSEVCLATTTGSAPRSVRHSL